MCSTADHLKRSLSYEDAVLVTLTRERELFVTVSDSNPGRQAQRNYRSFTRRRSHAARINWASTEEIAFVSSKSKHKENISTDVSEKITVQSRASITEKKAKIAVQGESDLAEICRSTTTDAVANTVLVDNARRLQREIDDDINVQTATVVGEDAENFAGIVSTAETVAIVEIGSERNATSQNISTENVVLIRTVKRGTCKVALSTLEAAGTSGEPTAEIDLPTKTNECLSCNTHNTLSKQKTPDRSLPTSKGKHRRKDRSQRVGKKWKPIPEAIELDFRMSLFPRNIPADCDLDEEAIRRKLEQFQQALHFTEDAGCQQPAESELMVDKTVKSDQSQAKVEAAENDETPSCAKEAAISSNSDHLESCLNLEEKQIKKASRDDTLFDDDYFDCLSFYEDKIPRRSLPSLASCPYLPAYQKQRVKKKQKKTKAHIQVKSKHCRGVGNSVHGQQFYFNFRVVQRMHMQINPIIFRVFNSPLSLRWIDKNKGLSTVRVKEPAQGRKTSSNRRPASVPNSRFAMDAYNADDALSADLVNVLMNIQHRELLPEDYDLLLRLDDRVAQKIVDSDILSTMKTEVVGQDGRSDLCAICMESYEAGQTVKHLPCGHCYHETCIDMWLSNSSQNCPLDGIPVGPS